MFYWNHIVLEERILLSKYAKYMACELKIESRRKYAILHHRASIIRTSRHQTILAASWLTAQCIQISDWSRECGHQTAQNCDVFVAWCHEATIVCFD